MSAGNFDKTGVTKALVAALALTLGALSGLGWQYRQLEEKRLPALEREIERQGDEIERRAAQDALENFMAARIGGNKAQAIFYLTENAVEQEKAGSFSIANGFESFRILNGDKVGEDEFRFAVEVRKTRAREAVEAILIKKILGDYYIDSVEMAG